jgi:hypothetical protein
MKWSGETKKIQTETPHGAGGRLRMSWEAKDTLIVATLAIVGAAIALAVGGYRERDIFFDMWSLYRTHEAIIWVIIGLVIGAGLGVVVRLISK